MTEYKYITKYGEFGQSVLVKLESFITIPCNGSCKTVVKPSARGLLGTGLASPYWLQEREFLKGSIGKGKVITPLLLRHL